MHERVFAKPFHAAAGADPDGNEIDIATTPPPDAAA